MVALQVENVIASSSLGKEVELVRLGTELEHAQHTRWLTPSVIVDLAGDGAGGRAGRASGLDLGLAARYGQRGVEPLGPLALERLEVSRSHASPHGRTISKATHAIQSSQKIASLPPLSVMSRNCHDSWSNE